MPRRTCGYSASSYPLHREGTSFSAICQRRISEWGCALYSSIRSAARALAAFASADAYRRHPLFSSVPSPYHRRTWAASCSDFVTKSEDAVELVRRWYGDGTSMVLQWYGDIRGRSGIVFPRSAGAAAPCSRVRPVRLCWLGCAGLSLRWWHGIVDAIPDRRKNRLNGLVHRSAMFLGECSAAFALARNNPEILLPLPANIRRLAYVAA